MDCGNITILYSGKEDVVFTENLKKAGEVLELNLLDHVIIGDNNFYSFCNEKRL